MTLQQYLDKINTLYKTGNAREHSYRGDLQNLIMAILPDVLVTNEPARVDCGAPDYVLTRKDVPIGYIEAKDIGVDLGSKTLKEQFDRYKSGLTNLIFTDYMDFHFYKEGEFVTKIAIAKAENGSIVPIPENFETFTNLIKNFSLTVSQTIKSPTKLAQMMAGKAKLMADVIEKSLHQDDVDQKRTQIKSQMLSFQQMLIHDIDNKAFADIYAQTIAYGMFAARYHDPTLIDFSREEASRLIPKSNPFLRKLFQDIAGYDLDNRLVWIVDELVSIFLASDVADIMKNFGKSTKQEDPVVHFYETFLGEYNPALRKARGVWYTPQPVVNFIVRAVDDILKTEFNLPQGLADTSKTKVKVDYYGKKIEKEVHKVQILDPATGTGTFLAEVVKHIYKKFEGQQGIWSKYVANDLIPRLNGFELLMASYAMAHLKMDMLLTETGYKPTDDQRFKIFLTNSLEEAHQDSGTLFSSWLSDESNQANEIKRDTPVMCVIGNPPYSVSSTNKSPWIENLIADYKKDLNERKINLDDDYIKFTRFGQHYIDKNGEGILAYISNNSFIEGITHRQMRKHLLESFDKIYILDLHGNARKKEVCSDGSPDQNVFDIMQGVSINIFIKTGKKKAKELGKVFHSELQGKREYKYETLNDNSIDSIEWKKLEFTKPNYFFVPKNFEEIKSYEKGFNITEIFIKYSAGIKTKIDHLATDFEKDKLALRVNEIITNKLSFEEIRIKYGLSERTTWEYKPEHNLIFDSNKIEIYNYRPFDKRSIYFDDKFLSRSRKEISKHLIKENLSLTVVRQSKIDNSNLNCLVSKKLICEDYVTNHSFAIPLYLYPDEKNKDLFETGQERTPNLNMEIVNQMSEGLGLQFVPEKDLTGFENLSGLPKIFAPIDILDYIYAVLHSPNYREKYKEFLKIDFPRVPYPKDKETFWQLVQLGGELRQIHLLESPIVEKYITGYPEDGDNVVIKPHFVISTQEKSHNENLTKCDASLRQHDKTGRVYINSTQYFNNVPEVAWNFYIGGYQPAQKWLKDRKDRELSYEDILHYQKIIVALTETDRLMKEIDLIEI
jgi:predicted helicase